MSARRPIAQHADQAGLAQAPMDLDAPLLQAPGDQVRGTGLLERQFRVGVDVAADGRQTLGFAFDVGDKTHCRFSLTSLRWQALLWPGASMRSTGASVRQRDMACGQRGWKVQPEGGRSGEGNSPWIGW
jgi:hypothetical protein